MDFAVNDVIELTGGSRYLILSSTKLLYLGNKNVLFSKEIELSTKALSEDELKGAKVIGSLSLTSGARRSSDQNVLTMNDLLILLDCAKGSINADDDCFSYNSADREEVAEKVEERLSQIALQITATERVA